MLQRRPLDFLSVQSAWQMPGRESGFFTAWSRLARRNLRLFLRGLHIQKILVESQTPEGIIAFVLEELGLPEDAWPDLIVRELTRMHGWAGFIRWRSTTSRYHWAQEYPADLVDFLAIRLVLALALIREHARRRSRMSWRGAGPPRWPLFCASTSRSGAVPRASVRHAHSTTWRSVAACRRRFASSTVIG